MKNKKVILETWPKMRYGSHTQKDYSEISSEESHLI